MVRWLVGQRVVGLGNCLCGQGATKGNSGIVHAGFDDKPGSVRAKFCWKGNQMFPQVCGDGFSLVGMQNVHLFVCV